MNKTINIFVYGTLKIGGYFAKRFDRFRVSSKSAIIQGALFQTNGGYPALNKEKGTVHGELHEYKDPINVLRKMDYIEGFNGEKSRGNLFTREKALIKTDEGNEHEAYVYFYNYDIDKNKRIKNGTWKLQ